MQGQVVNLPPFGRDVEVRASSYREDDNSIEVIWTTGAPVRRYSWRDGVYYDEVLDVTSKSVRLDRLNRGAPFLDTHDNWSLGSVIGAVVPGSAEIRGGKGYARVSLSVAPEHAGIVANIRAGVINNISVGYNIHKVEKTVREEGQPEEWRVTDWEPMELSAVPIPADAGSQIRSEEQAGKGGNLRLSPCEFVETRSGGDDETSRAEEDGSNKETEMTKPAPAADDTRGLNENAPAPVAAPVVDTRMNADEMKRVADEAAARAVEADRARSSEIRKIAEQFGAREFGETHAASNTDVATFRSLMLDHLAAREVPQGITGVRAQMGETDVEKRAAAIENALLHRADPGKYQLSNEGRNFRGRTLLEIADDCLEARGIKTRGMSKMERADAALSQRSGGMHSTGDFPIILANIANKSLRAAYAAMPQTFRPLIREASVSDFKAVTRTQLGEAPSFDKVNEHGEFKRGTMGEAKESYSIATYGKVVGITRQTIINDDMNAFSRVPAAFGVQAAQLESDLVWGQILANPVMGDGNTLFHANHGNLMTAAAISVAGLTAARTAFALQKGLDGKTVLGLTPQYIIVPVALQTVAEQLRGQIFPAKNSDAVPESLKLDIIAEPRLDNGITRPEIGINVAGSASNWYVGGLPNIVDLIELAYLDGNTGVYTETRMGFDIDGVEIKVRMDVGAKVLDWRNIAKNPN